MDENHTDKRNDTPEKRLWVTCLLEAMRSAKKGDEEDRSWLLEHSDPQQVGSFAFICRLLGLAPGEVRSRIIQNWNLVDCHHSFARILGGF